MATKVNIHYLDLFVLSICKETNKNSKKYFANFKELST